MNIINEANISVGEFSKTPYGRYEKDGKYNAAEFRDSKLVPALNDPTIQIINIYLDTVEEGYEYGSSFLEEAFGGLVRKCGFSAAEVNKKLNIITKHKDYILEINEYLEQN